MNAIILENLFNQNSQHTSPYQSLHKQRLLKKIRMSNICIIEMFSMQYVQLLLPFYYILILDKIEDILSL